MKNKYLIYIVLSTMAFYMTMQTNNISIVSTKDINANSATTLYFNIIQNKRIWQACANYAKLVFLTVLKCNEELINHFFLVFEWDRKFKIYRNFTSTLQSWNSKSFYFCLWQLFSHVQIEPLMNPIGWLK